MDKPLKLMVIGAICGIALTALSVLVYDGGGVAAVFWGFPVPYFEKWQSTGVCLRIYSAGPCSSSGVSIIWPQALFDIEMWFLLSMAAVGASSFAFKSRKPLTRNATGIRTTC
jgi:hypothetical protein